MTPEELQIWIAAYSNAFVSQFKSRVELYESLSCQKEDAFTRTAKSISGEVAFTIADLAVQEFRYWKENEETDWPNHKMYDWGVEND